MASTVYRDGGMGRTALSQGAYQIAAVGLTLALAIVSGTLTGLLIRLPIFEQIEDVEDLFDDEPHWLTPADFPIQLNEIKVNRTDEEYTDEKV